MPSDSSSDFKLEIGHVLLIDIVGYSKLLITAAAAPVPSQGWVSQSSLSAFVKHAFFGLVRPQSALAWIAF